MSQRSADTWAKKELASQVKRNQLLEERIDALLRDNDTLRAQVEAGGTNALLARLGALEAKLDQIDSRVRRIRRGQVENKGRAIVERADGSPQQLDQEALIEAVPTTPAVEDKLRVKLFAKVELLEPGVWEHLSDFKSLLSAPAAFTLDESYGHHSLTWEFTPAGPFAELRLVLRCVQLALITIRVRSIADKAEAGRFEIVPGDQGVQVFAFTPGATACVKPLASGWSEVLFRCPVVAEQPFELILSAMDEGKAFSFAARADQRIDLGLVGYRSVAGGEEETATPPSILRPHYASRPIRPAQLNGKPVSAPKWAEIAEKRAELEREFARSGMLDRVAALKDIHKGKRAFVIGNGPSLKTQDLTLLRDEITFVSNWFIHHEKFADINPKYYCISSHEMFGGWGKPPKLNDAFAALLMQKRTEQRLFLSSKFVQHVVDLGIAPERDTYGLIFDRPKFLVDEMGAQNYDLSKPMDDGYTALLTFCIPLCAHFGISEVYMLGCDCDYQIAAPEDPKAYFYSFEKHKTQTTSFDSLQRIWAPGGPIFQTYRIVREEAALRGVSMFNATAGGALEELPRVNFEAILS